MAEYYYYMRRMTGLCHVLRLPLPSTHIISYNIKKMCIFHKKLIDLAYKYRKKYGRILYVPHVVQNMEG